LGDHLTLVLRDRRQDVDRQLVGVRVIDRDEFDAAVHECGNERQVAG